jgi:hypothetical protein
LRTIWRLVRSLSGKGKKVDQGASKLECSGEQNDSVGDLASSSNNGCVLDDSKEVDKRGSQKMPILENMT